MFASKVLNITHAMLFLPPPLLTDVINTLLSLLFI